jgi:aspartate kinase
VVGVASERDVIVLTASAASVELLALLDERAVSGKQLHVARPEGGREAVSLVISRENLHDEDRLRRDVDARFGGAARLVDGLGAVSVIGAGINASYANVRAGSACLTELGLEAADLSTSSFRITWLIPRPHLDRAVRALHRLFIEAAPPQVP